VRERSKTESGRKDDFIKIRKVGLAACAGEFETGPGSGEGSERQGGDRGVGGVRRRTEASGHNASVEDAAQIKNAQCRTFKLARLNGGLNSVVRAYSEALDRE